MTHVWYMPQVPRTTGFGRHSGCDVLFWPCRIAFIAKLVVQEEAGVGLDDRETQTDEDIGTR